VQDTECVVLKLVLWRNNLRSLVEDLVDSVWGFQSLWKQQQHIRRWKDFWQQVVRV